MENAAKVAEINDKPDDRYIAAGVEEFIFKAENVKGFDWELSFSRDPLKNTCTEITAMKGASDGLGHMHSTDEPMPNDLLARAVLCRTKVLTGDFEKQEG